MERAVRRYIEGAKDDRRKVYDRLEKIILGLYPNAQATISYTIVKYKTAGGEVWLGYWKEGSPSMLSTRRHTRLRTRK